MDGDEHCAEGDKERRQGKEAVLLQGGAVDLGTAEDHEQAPDEAADVEDDERVDGAVHEHFEDVGVGVVVGFPHGLPAMDVQGSPRFGQELRARESDAVEAKVEQEPGQRGADEGAPVAFGPEVLGDVLAGQMPVRVEGGGLEDLGLGGRAAFAETLARDGHSRHGELPPGVLGVQRRCLVEEGGGVELGLDGVVFDLEQEARRFGDDDSEQCRNDTRHDADPDHPPPHDIKRADEVVVMLVLADGYHDQGDDVSRDLSQWLHEEDGGHHAGAMLGRSESTKPLA